MSTVIGKKTTFKIFEVTALLLIGGGLGFIIGMMEMQNIIVGENLTLCYPTPFPYGNITWMDEYMAKEPIQNNQTIQWETT